MALRDLPRTPRAAPGALRRAVAQHAHEPLTLTDVAAAGTTVRALQYALQRHDALTPMQYLSRERLARAHLVLQSSDPATGVTVTDVAYRWGFTNPGRFAQQYHQVDGVSPAPHCAPRQRCGQSRRCRGGKVIGLSGDAHPVFLAKPADRPPGIALAVKDLFDTAGLTTTYGSRIFADHVPERSADAVTRLEAGGYGVIGKTNLCEFAYGITSQNAHYGTVLNPLDRSRTAGGSSGGSAAAVSAGLAQVALGTDSGGSIRIPSACCGVVGFKPTHGLVSLRGCFPLAPSFDHAGPIARTAQGCTEAMAALVPKWTALRLTDLGEVTVGVAWTEHADETVRASVQRAAARLPRRRSLPFPLPQFSAAGFMSEVADTHRELFAAHGDAYSPDVRAKVQSCLEVSQDHARTAHDARERYRQEALDALDGVDLLLTPTLPILAPAVDAPDVEVRESMTRMTHGFNALGWPAIALPCPSEESVPASVQLVGRPGDDALVLAAAQLLELAVAQP